jgi:hypothetical protein
MSPNELPYSLSHFAPTRRAGILRPLFRRSFAPERRSLIFLDYAQETN